MTTCSATLTTLDPANHNKCHVEEDGAFNMARHGKDAPVTSATVTPIFAAASRLTWSEPMPAVRASFSFLAFPSLSGVR